MTALDHAVAEIEKGRTVVDGLPTHTSQTGEQYTEIMGGMFDGELAAALDWLERARKFAGSKPGAIYWRIRPEMNSFDTGKGRKFRVYSRLLVSEKPVIYPDLDALDRARSAA